MKSKGNKNDTVILNHHGRKLNQAHSNAFLFGLPVSQIIFFRSHSQ